MVLFLPLARPKVEDGADCPAVAADSSRNERLHNRTLLRDLKLAIAFAHKNLLVELLLEVSFEVANPLGPALGIAALAALEPAGLGRMALTDVLAVIGHPGTAPERSVRTSTLRPREWPCAR